MIYSRSGERATFSTCFLSDMVQYCIAAGCSNTRSDGVSLFKFPSDPLLREKWTREVKGRAIPGAVLRSTAFCLRSSSAAPVASTSTSLLVKKPRKAYEKRDSSRVR